MKCRNKIPFFLLISVICAMLFAVSPLAYFASDEDGNDDILSGIFDIIISGGGVSMPEGTVGGDRLTPDGNMTLIDDILQNDNYFVSEEKEVEDKQFITVQTKNGNYFYLIIDRSGDTENVYFLNLVDESDLLSLMESADTAEKTCNCTEKCIVGKVNTACEICASNLGECRGLPPETEPPETQETEEAPKEEPEEEKKGSGSIIAVILIILVGGGIAAYFLLFKNKKQKPKVNDEDLSDYDFGVDDEDAEESEEEEFENDE